MLMASLILSIYFISASLPCILQMHNGDSIDAPGVSSTKHLLCDGLRCTCVGLSTPNSFIQVCVNSSRSYYFGNPADCVDSCNESERDETNLSLIANFPFKNNGVFTKQTFFLDIMTNKISSIYLIDNIAGTQFNLCPNCLVYKRSRTFKQGPNDITIRAVSGGEVVEKNIKFIIDNKKPRITKTFPMQNKFANGDFSVIYEEDNLNNVTLFYNSYLYGPNITREVELKDCPDGKNMRCDVNVNLSELDGREMTYWFVISDIANNSVKSRVIKEKVDLTQPKLIGEIKYSIKGLVVKFNMTIEEKNFYRVEYVDLNARDQRPKVLCSSLTKDGNCVRQMSFLRGPHDLSIQISDKAGNSIGESLSFVV